MISDLSVLIQFLAAIYVTISLDNLIGRRFWSPDYYNLVDQQLQQAGKEFSTRKLKQLKDKIREREKSLDGKSRKRGVFMLFWCTTFLIYIGFEKQLHTNANSTSLFAPFVMLFVSSIILLSSHFSLNTWKKTIQMCLLTVASGFIYFIVGDKMLSPEGVRKLCPYTKILLVVIALLPIIYQLYVNWLYSKAFIIYLHEGVTKELEFYKKTKKGIESGKAELIQGKYDHIIKELYVSNIKGDKAITSINNQFYVLLEKACMPPTPMKLLWFWWKNRKAEISEKENDTIEIEEELPVSESSIIENSNQGFELLYAEYESIKTKNNKTLRKFCKKKKINYDGFSEYYKKRLAEMQQKKIK